MTYPKLDPELMMSMRINNGENLFDLCQKQPVMLVFLRHFGCVFCKEALTDISNQRESIENKGTKLVFVHMANEELADEYFKKYEIQDPLHISDPKCEYYSEFGITKGNFSQLYGLRTWIRGYSARKVGHELEVSQTLGDSTQMPGIYIIDKNEVKSKYIHKYASDRPDYIQLAASCEIQTS